MSQLGYPAEVSDPQQAMDLDEVIRVLVSLGIDEDTARGQLHAAEDDATTVIEVAALTVESEAGVLMPLDSPLRSALFELIDGLRQAGIVVSLEATANAQALAFGQAPEQVLEVVFDEDVADVRALVRAVSRVLPDTHHLLIAPDYDAGEALALAILDRASYAWLRAAVGVGRLEKVLLPASGSAPGVSVTSAPRSVIAPVDFDARFVLHPPDVDPSTSVEGTFARVAGYDPRVVWPEGQRRPPGDDFFELSTLLAGVPLSRCLQSGSPAQWANLMYRFALVTSVGAHWDMLAARLNPGMSAQGLLGLGQLCWSWFIFEALGARQDASRVSRLLDVDWIRNQERGMVSARQRAYFDLAWFLIHGKRRPALGRVRELLPLMERAGFEDPARLQAALAVHSEPEGDQLTHHALYYVWPAPIYALARRAGALDLLPETNPFLSRPLLFDDVDVRDEWVRRLHGQLARFDAMDEARLPPLLDPLPVIVDVRVTEVDARDAHGRTMLAQREDAEHHVVAPHHGRALRPGDVWLFEVQGARPARGRARYEDLGDVSYNIALPTGEWLSKVDMR